MPCPASLEERAQARLDVVLPELREKLRAQVPHLALMRRVARALHERSPLDDPEHELAQAWKLAEPFEQRGVLPVFTGPRPVFANWVDEEDIRRQEAEESWLTAMVRDSELAACILGCAVTRWVRARQLKSDELLALEVEAAIGAHRRHRDEDRAARLATLEADLRSRPSPQLEGARARLEALAGPRLYEERKSVFSP